MGETRDIGSIGVKRNTETYGVLVGQPERMRSLGRSRHTKEHTINSDIKRIWWSCVDWIYLAQEMVQLRALVNTVMNISVSKKVGNSLELWAPVSLSMRYVSWGLLYGQYEQPAHSNALLMRLWQFPHHLCINARFFLHLNYLQFSQNAPPKMAWPLRA